MEPDKYQQAWRAQTSATRVTVDAESLRQVLQRNQRELRTVSAWRDPVLVAFLLLLLPPWIYAGIAMDSPVTWYFMVPVDLATIARILELRAHRKRPPIDPAESLLSSVQESLDLVEDQIRWQRNLFWWYIVPTWVGCLAFVAHVITKAFMAFPPRSTFDWCAIVGGCVFLFVSSVAVAYVCYYWYSRQAALKYEPQRQELLALLARLREDGTSAVARDYPILMGTTPVALPRPRMLVAGLFFVACLLLAVGFFLVGVYEKAVGPVGVVAVTLIGIAVLIMFAYLLSSGHDDANDATLRPAKSVENARTLRWGMIAVGCLATLVAIALASRLFKSGSDQPPQVEGPGGAPLGRLITDLRNEKNLVGLAAMVTVDGKVDAAAADGERKIGSGVSVQIGDRWHLGGITKSITATMIARLIESGRMHWSDTVGTAFPKASVNADWKPVTLGQLLTDTAGAPAYFSSDVLSQRPAPGPACTRARRKVVLDVIAEKPSYPPGTKFEYSNVGYTIAAAMAEEATGVTWEDLVKREVFEPLKLKDAGFGPPKSGDTTLEEPRGHRKMALFGKVAVDDKTDNTCIMGPAANVNMTLANLCTYAGEHLQGAQGKGRLLSAAIYKRLHTPVLDHYACGWSKKEPNAETPCTIYWHNGSNTLWYALVVFAPEKNMVVAVVSNDGDFASAEAAAWQVVTTCLAGDFTRKAASTATP